MTTYKDIICPKCHHKTQIYHNPSPTVDIIIEYQDKIILIEKLNEPFGYAIPGGFVDYNETIENAAIREAKEETSLDVKLKYLLGAYSDPKRDPRQHTISSVFVAEGFGELKAGDDAKNAILFDYSNIDETDLIIVFDHKNIIRDYIKLKKGERTGVKI
jgi:ADP-ribose pyrophosphatase YjhB (NUDIX family)